MKLQWIAYLIAYANAMSPQQPAKKITGFLGRLKSKQPHSKSIEKGNYVRDIELPVNSVKLDARELEKEAFISKYDNQLPIVLRNVLKEGFNDEEWTADLIGHLRKESVEFDIRLSKTMEVETYEGIFEDFLEAISESTHEESFYLMNENILGQVNQLMEGVLYSSCTYLPIYLPTYFA